MILSHEHEFVFIKGVKVAGTSAEIALSQVCGEQDVITPITPADERHRLGTPGEPRNYTSRSLPRFVRKYLEGRYISAIRSGATRPLVSVRRPIASFRNHMGLREVLRLAPEAAGYERICVERSPYAKVMSLANWKANDAAYAQGEELAKAPSSMADSVDRLIANESIRHVLNIDRYREADGRIGAICWNTETLGEDLREFLRSRGLPAVAVVHAKRGFGSGAVDPRDVLRRDQILLINELFAEEFATFGWPMIN